MTATSSQSGASDEETLGALIANASRDLSALVRSEVELAKAEIRQDVANGAKGGAMFGAAGFLAVLAVVLLSVAAAYGLVALGLHPAVAFLIVAVAYLLLAGVLVLVGKKTVSKVGPPQRAIRTSKETAAFLKNRKAPDGASPTKT
ncbi:MAG: phage holin family protein [Actinomycetes bacterium]